MSSTALSSTFELPPDDRTYTWMRDGLHVPRPLPRLVGHAMQRWFQESMGNRWQLVNGYAYMGFAGSGPAFSVEPAPQTDAGAAWREFYLPRVVAIVERRLAMDYSGLDPAAMLAGFDDAIRDAAVAFAYTMAPIGPLSGPMAEHMGFCAAKSWGGRCALVESRSSKPLIAESSTAQSSALRAIGPAWSRLEANATMP